MQCKNHMARNVQSEESELDESDEDYIEVDDEELDDGDSSSSLAEDESEENLVEFQEKDHKNIRMNRYGGGNSLQGRRDGAIDKRRKHNRSSRFEEDYVDSDCDSDVKEFSTMRKKVGRVQKRRRNGKMVKKKLVREKRETKEVKSRLRSLRRKRRMMKPFANPRSSDHNDTISEKEREQVREACKNPSFSNMINEVKTEPLRRKLPRKGKEEVVEMKSDPLKQICGICLSEEGKRAVRGILSCCSHYFCLTCIIDWSKVESRCPLCKQRFTAIKKASKFGNGVSLRDAVIQVPERDQIYQPSEEELRSSLDPYENVLCSECHQGGDDALMLLCDLCDSSAHTYCVGLGREVPEGNWYCNGCIAPASSNSASTSEGNCNSAALSSPMAIVQEASAINELYAPDTPLIQVEFQGASGSGALTLSERRRIQRHIRQLLCSRSRNMGRYNSLPRMPPPYNAPEGRLFSPRLSSLTGRVLDSQASASLTPYLDGLHRNDSTRFSSRIFDGSGHLPSHPYSSSSSQLPPQFMEAKTSLAEKGRVQSLVKSHLKCLSRDFELGSPFSICSACLILVFVHWDLLSLTDAGYLAFKNIARTSTHTVLAAVGVEHRSSEVYPGRARPLRCDHSQSRQICQIGGQCSSCFDWFVRNVVREVMCARVSTG